MNDLNSKETRSFRDPMATRLEASRQRQEVLNALYPEVTVVYDGFYLHLDTLTNDGNRYFLGAEGIIGSRLDVRASVAEAGVVWLCAADGRRLAQILGEDGRRISQHLTDGWQVKVLVSTTFFKSQDKSAAVDVAFICWGTQGDGLDAALANFAKNIAERLARGDRADIDLSQEQFVDVLRSSGEWFLTATIKRKSPEKGTIVYKGSRSGTERLTGYALNHRKGCNVLAIIFWVWLAVVLAALVWFFFLN